MIRMLRAETSCMLRIMVALLKAPATRGMACVACSTCAALPRSTAMLNSEATSPSPVRRLSACRSM